MVWTGERTEQNNALRIKYPDHFINKLFNILVCNLAHQILGFPSKISITESTPSLFT